MATRSQVRAFAKVFWWNFQLAVVQDFYLFPLEGSEVVLGLAWLGTLGDVIANFRESRLVIYYDKGWVVLKGDLALCYGGLALCSAVRAFQGGEIGFMIQLWPVTAMGEGEHSLLAPIAWVLEENPAVFQPLPGLPPNRKHDHAIVLKEGTSVPNIRPYYYLYYQKTAIEDMVQEMLQLGIIHPSVSPYASPIILVKKKDGSWRFCVDYRTLNKIIVPDKFPILVIDELLDELTAATIFSKLDLKSCYHQIRMVEDDIKKTVFQTHERHYEFIVMPFGLTNTPSTFEALLNQVLRPYVRKFVLVFLDDILVYSKDMESHAQHLRTVFQLLLDNCLVVNKKKCDFGVDKVEYLGHVVFAAGLYADPRKAEAMLQWLVPKDVKALRGFLGLMGYYHRFVKDYGVLARPLIELTKKNGFSWSPTA